ncbi:MAG: CSLREA domain-containing protein, partial [Planctomycetaceae bacterium]|nr:CSLREA domain-containing protein [Planctomycetaceae bacterium]
MIRLNWLAAWMSRSQTKPRCLAGHRSLRSRRTRQTVAEQLESRWLLSMITVTTLNDEVTNDGNVSLREAIQAANTDTSVDGSTVGSGADTIIFAASLTASAPATISLSLFDTGLDSTEFGSTAFLITSDITIQGATGSNGITIERDSAAANFRLFHVGVGDSLTLNDLTLSNGVAQGGAGGSSNDGGSGGGAAGLGGAIFNQGTLTVRRSTLSGNIAQGGDGGDRNGGNTYGGGGGGGLGGNGTNTAPVAGGAGGAPNGGSSAGGNGGIGGGGGGGNLFAIGGPGSGGAGGFGGGGGGSGLASGSGGFVPGLGGFGGGGGGGGSNQSSGGVAGAIGGFGGGTGGTSGSSGTAGRLGNGGGGGGGGAGLGGGIFNDGGTVTITNSTLSSNMAQGGTGGTGGNVAATAGSGLGGGLFNLNGSVTIRNTTIAGNTADSGGAVFNVAHETGSGVTAAAATVTLQNSILADSTATSDLVNEQRAGASAATVTATAPNIVEVAIVNTGGTVNGSGVSNVDPLLEAPNDNGGPTKTLKLLTGSPAINAGNNALVSETTDQRGDGFFRIDALVVDLGAFEVQSPRFVVTTTNDELDGVFDANDLSLREALVAANSDSVFSVVVLPAGTFTLSLTGSEENLAAVGDLDITQSVAIVGAGANLTIVNGGGIGRVFDVLAGVIASILNVTIQGGGAVSHGAGIRNAGTLTIDNSTIAGNTATGFNGGGLTGNTVEGGGGGSAGLGGAIFNQGSLTIQNSTISGNVARG